MGVTENATVFQRDSSKPSPQTNVATIAPRHEPRSRIHQIPTRLFSKKEESNEIFVSIRRQRLNCFRRMLITRSDDGYFGRIPEIRILKSSFKLEEVQSIATQNATTKTYFEGRVQTGSYFC